MSIANDVEAIIERRKGKVEQLQSRPFLYEKLCQPVIFPLLHFSTQKQHRYYKYLAVKKAEISCEFNFADAGKIVLQDTIGLGDTSLGIEEAMLDWYLC